ncbi:DNA-binding LacI/PurR family transcriptional regulator [Thermocatellispora tengchongensis]|uniref:DNA-binding LacI/PurR family transcriptional regulator n=1 Tax=Thermocatellispora tengchongensis TaxID=1073253 RepID=A0A840P458_9ACTN|nr:GntR family transcriptional regulator [Thermocatellispora tengchongensis]MBB5133779.1 DNA-binding LacI/PurR family transcriptional regulator [Thermocatellispora tengchongensis]
MTATSPGEGLPLYRQIVNELHAAILRNEYVPGKPFISQREVCERFGVSTATAVRALNEMVGQGILIRQRGRGTFVAERDVRAAATPGERETATIACVLFGLGSGHVSGMLSGVEAMCKEMGYRLLLSNSEWSPEQELLALRQARQDGVSGIVLFPVEGSSNALAIEEIRQSGIPVVMVDRYLPEIATSAVTADNVAVGYRVTEKLIEQGHRRIATLWDEIDCTSVRDRLTGHKQALVSYKVPEDPELTVLRSYQKMPEATRRQYLAGLLDGPEPPTALLCAHGYALATAMQDLRDLDPALLDRLALASMDDVAPFDIVPFITAAAVLPSKEMGRAAVELLQEDGARHIVLPIEVREGAR